MAAERAAGGVAGGLGWLGEWGNVLGKVFFFVFGKCGCFWLGCFFGEEIEGLGVIGGIFFFLGGVGFTRS